jgi:hypothetical protein
MNWTRFIIAWLVGAVVLVAVGILWHAVLFSAAYDSMMKAVDTAKIYPVAIAVEVIRGLLFAYIYPQGFKGGAPWMEGLRFGILMALVSAAIPALYLSVMTVSSASWFWADMVFLLVQGALAGVAIALVYGTVAGKPA